MVTQFGDFWGMTDFDLDPDTERLARGMFVNDDGDLETQLGEAYVTYKDEKFSLHGGLQMYKTPLTTIAYSTMPNFYSTVGGALTVLPDTTLGAAQIIDISWGARSMTDFGLIGEGTKSAGAAINTSSIGQAEFHDVSTATLGNNAPSTNGITVLSAEYAGIKNTKLGFWNYYVDDIANNFYTEVNTVFPFKEGAACLAIRDGQEHFTIQYAEDWVNFKVAAITELMPTAAGPYVPDAFTDAKDGRGITWGLSHFTNAAGDWKRNHAVLTRFDCDLSQDVHDPEMKGHSIRFAPEEHYRRGLSKKQRQRLMDETARLKRQ